MKIESRIGTSESSDEKIYTFVTDFNNFKDLLPGDKITDWKSSGDSCSFRVDPVGRMALQIIEKEPYKLVKMSSVPALSPHEFIMWVQLKQVAENDTRIKISIEPQVNKMMLPMIKGPLKKFADSLIDRMEDYSF